MPVNPDWIPQGWAACDARCEPPEPDIDDENKPIISCRCVEECLVAGPCSCRLVRRKKKERDPQEPDGWTLGPPEMYEHRCEETKRYDSKYLYKCLCLKRAAPGKK